MHMKWRRLSLRDRQFVWRMYGNFTLLMFCGSVVGVFAWLSYMQSTALFFIANHALTNKTPGVSYFQIFGTFGASNRWGAAYRVLYPLEFMSISVTKLLAVDRVLGLAPPDADAMKTRLTGAARLVLASVVLGNMVGISGGTAASVLLNKAADNSMHAAAAFFVNDTASAFHFLSVSTELTQLSDEAASVQSFSEVAVLLFILVAFFVAAAVFAWYARAALQDLQLAAAGDVVAISRVDEFSGMRSEAESRELAAIAGSCSRRLWKQVLGSVMVIFSTFLLRAIEATFYAVAKALQNQGALCMSPDLCDTECYNSFSIFLAWIFYTPEFQLIVVIISAPFTLLVALWGMTNQRMLQLMAASKAESSIAPARVIRSNLNA